MSRKVNKRSYESPERRASAARTRHDVLAAARKLFVAKGFSGTTMAAVAKAAGVAPDTIYETIGAKPVLFRELIETALSGTDEVTPALERDYVKEIEAEQDAGARIDRYAKAVASIQPRLAPLLNVLRDAGGAEPGLRRLWRELSERRAANMRLFTQGLARVGGLREGLSVEEAADIVWSMNSAEFYELLVTQRGWSPERFERFLVQAWRRLLLSGPDQR